MHIIDAQIHLWTKGTVVPPHRTAPYLVDEALGDMDAAGVNGAILHPPSWDPDSNAQAVEAARLHPGRFAILGRIPLDRPELRGQIETWRQQPGMLGLRYTFLQSHMKSWPTDGTMDWLSRSRMVTKPRAGGSSADTDHQAVGAGRPVGRTGT